MNTLAGHLILSTTIASILILALLVAQDIIERMRIK